MAHKLVLVGGLAGSGKTYIGKEISKKVGIFIDKDTVSRFFAESLLEKLGSHKNDRESEVYLKHVRDLEYETMMKHAFENLELGHNVICSAPFIKEFKSNNDWLDNQELEAEIFDAELITIWIHADELTTRDRLVARAADRDNHKLANWDEYTSQVKHQPPEEIENIFVIDNTSQQKETLPEQINKVIKKIMEY